MGPDLQTTNIILGVMAAVSAIQLLALAAAGLLGYRLYRQLARTIEQAVQTIKELEARQVAPLTAQVHAILADVKDVTGRVSGQTERVDQALSDTFERVDETTTKVRDSLHSQVWRLIGIARGLRAAARTIVSSGESDATARRRTAHGGAVS